MNPCALTGLALWLALALVGCMRPATGAKELRSVSATPPRAVDRADIVDLWAVPPAVINWDDVPGPDGVRVCVFLYRSDRPEPVLVKGEIEFLMFDGRVPRDGLTTAKPFQVWRYAEKELAASQMRGVAGWGYAAQLGWGRNVPKSAAITVTARYLPPTGSPLYASPFSLAMPSAVRSGPTRSTIGGLPPVPSAPTHPQEPKPSPAP